MFHPERRTCAPQHLSSAQVLAKPRQSTNLPNIPVRFMHLNFPRFGFRPSIQRSPGSTVSWHSLSNAAHRSSDVIQLVEQTNGWRAAPVWAENSNHGQYARSCSSAEKRKGNKGGSPNRCGPFGGKPIGRYRSTATAMAIGIMTNPTPVRITAISAKSLAESFGGFPAAPTVSHNAFRGSSRVRRIR